MNRIVLHDAGSRCWLKFSNPLRVLVAKEIESIEAVFRSVEREVGSGSYAAGFVSYEAGPAFDSALVTRPPGNFPLAWFGIYREPERIDDFAFPPDSPLDKISLSWRPSVSDEEYGRAFEKIKQWIGDGDTYQVNYTFRLSAPFHGNPWHLFTDMVRSQGNGYGAFVDTEDWAICSASPELFFSLERGELVSMPMKGTAPRGMTLREDRQQADLLAESAKNRAENVMIVDMVRNDMGRICRNPGVAVTSLFDIEKYPTLWQMTSTVRGKTDLGFMDIFRALFPAASITGAPKVRTMQIIAELESTPRNIYTGAIGFLSPELRAQFNVAIRTVLVDKAAGLAEYGLGGGIVWDSENRDELAECHTKAKVLFQSAPDFDLLESILWTPAGQYHYLPEHMERLGESAAYFSRQFCTEAIEALLAKLALELPARAQKIRLLVSRAGGFKVEAEDLKELPAPYQVCLARSAMDRNDPFLYHKTTHRSVYDRTLGDCPGCDDVLLWNDRGELTESCRANLFLERDGILWTPPIHCGLLAGTYRARLLKLDQAREAVIRVEDLKNGMRIFLGNSVRGLWEIFPSLPD